MKRVLLLGGSFQQIVAIEYANKQNYYTVLCDYLPDNPGQHYADKFYCVSTTDKEAILEVAQKERVDGVVAYASDPAATTAAYVSEKLGLPTNPYKSVDILANKDKFRQFLHENGFNSPRANAYCSLNAAKKEVDQFTFPVMVKPVDSSGSKGVKKIESIKDLDDAFKNAFDYSRIKKVIIEEFIQQDHEYMIAGDCFVIDGEVAYWGFLNSHRSSKVNGLVPIGTSYPLVLNIDRIKNVKFEIQRLINLLNINFGAFNIEVMITNNEKIYLIELGPRNGGNLIPDFLNMINKVDLIGATVETALGNKEYKIESQKNQNFYFTYVLHTDKEGIFKSIKYKNGIENNIIKKVIYKKEGDLVQYFDGANKALGIIFLKFENKEEQQEFLSNTDKWIEIIVE